MTKEGKSIPVSKVARAAKVASASVKVGGNYIKHYSKKIMNMKPTQQELDEANADTIYDALSTLKGSALKAAQMMSMDSQTLPQAFQDKFAMAQYNAPALSGPLIVKTFKNDFGKSPYDVYEHFESKASYAASIGQVHEAELNGQKLAIKIQYPGVAESVKSDLKLVKPLALKYLKVKERDVKEYLEEVETKLLEETDYQLEVENGIKLSAACESLTNLVFPTYYPELSSPKIITMGWLNGQPISEFVKKNYDPSVAQHIGQTLWDFYNFQVFNLQKVHADPHPGNFLVMKSGQLGVLDFGCMKEIPQDFFGAFKSLLAIDPLQEKEAFEALLLSLDMIRMDDTDENKAYILKTFADLILILGKPYKSESFDFGDQAYFEQLYTMGEEVSNDIQKNKNLKSARGSKHFVYINRTFFGLYSILNMLKANVTTNIEEKFNVIHS